MIFIFISTQLAAQISTFPYTETFEQTDGGFSTGGFQSTWEWGNAAGIDIAECAEGDGCWVTNLAGSYRSGERSYLLSPLFDMRNLQAPIVRFDIFYETEREWDGVGLQYSVDAGLTWDDMPYFAPQSCMKQKWYNARFVTYLDFPGNNAGWSGNLTAIPGGDCDNGGGSAGWVRAQHCLSGFEHWPENLGGKPNVQFRFIFGAGTICEDEGIGIDNFSILESPVMPEFNFDCRGDFLDLEFRGSSKVDFCPAQGTEWVFEWDFGDPASQAANTGTGHTFRHIFSDTGIYRVLLKATNPCAGSDTISHLINVGPETCLPPLDSLAFSAFGKNDRIRLRWDTWNEAGTSRFLLERSSDGNTYWVIGEVEAAGQSTGQLKYQYDDLNLPLSDGPVYYRLKVEGIDGRLYEAAETTVYWKSKVKLGIFPNPISSGDAFYLNFRSNCAVPAEIRVVSAEGKIVWRGQLAGNDTYKIQPASLPAGVYLLEIKAAEERHWARLFVY